VRLGILDVVINGLPAGAQANVAVTGPGNYGAQLVRSTRLQDLTSGTYTVAAQAVTYQGVQYTPSPTSQSPVVSPGSTISAIITYQEVRRGTLNVMINGLPAGAQANVAVTGPDNYGVQLIRSSNLQNLTPGNYSVTARAVTHQGVEYSPSPLNQSRVVTSGGTATATVAYEAGILDITSVTPTAIPRVRVGQSYSYTVTLADLRGRTVSQASIRVEDAVAGTSNAVTTNSSGVATYRGTVPAGRTPRRYSVCFTGMKAGYRDSEEVCRTVEVIP
jgi:hypothetical protein